MRLLTLLGKCALALVIAVAGFTLYGKIQQRAAANPAAASGGKGLSPAGFFLLKREEAKNPRVVIMSPPNCPSHEAQRARALEASLRSAGVPTEMRDSLEFTFTDPAEAERVTKYMDHVANPLVLVRGWAKGNPTAQDVVAQYQAK